MGLVEIITGHIARHALDAALREDRRVDGRVERVGTGWGPEATAVHRRTLSSAAQRAWQMALDGVLQALRAEHELAAMDRGEG